MATYNKPGVYIEETLTPNIPTTSAISGSVAAFIGYADRGPTSGSSGNIAGTPTLVTSWNDFVNAFSYGSTVNAFTGIPTTILASASCATTSSVVTLNGANAAAVTDFLKVGSALTLVSGTGTLQPGTVVTGITDQKNFTISKTPSVALSDAVLSATEDPSLKYAVKSFFDNGGSQAYIVRDVNPNAISASVDLRDRNGQTTLAGAITFDATTKYANKLLTISMTSGTPFAGFSSGKIISFSGVSPANYTFLNNNQWVIDSVAGDSRSIDIVCYPDTAISSTATATTASVTVVGGAQSTVGSLRVTAKGAGGWGNGIWVGTYPNSSDGYFDLHVYYDVATTVSTGVTDADRVERFTYLNMDPTSDRYAPTAVNSSWITLTDLGSAATGSARLPRFTGTWGTATSYNVDTSNKYAFKWNVSSFTASPYAVRVGVSSDSSIQLSQTFGVDGQTFRTASNTIAKLDAVTSPLIINWANNSVTSDVNAMTAYAASRGDSFVVIDAADVSVSSVLGTTTDSGISSYSTNTNYGAAYYPRIVIADPASTTGGTVSIAPGGSVAAIYASTDASRGVYKAPAGAAALVRPAVSVASISNADFNLIGNNPVNLNVIRYVPGSGICVMGARTLSNASVDRYVPVRRTLNYLGSSIKNITSFAVFEPNDQNLWSQVNSVVNTFLNEFWRRGGLVGAIPSQAFYVRCDSTINTASAINAGELHIEVGVALQKPAEFVIIRLSQLNGGATVTTSV